MQGMMSASRTYQYTQLPPSYIRILELQPSLEVDASLCFNFQTLSIDDSIGDYEAISYTWGSQTLDRIIYHREAHGNDSCAVSITKNLDELLRYFRHPLKQRRLWADAVCINQKDDAEKSRQIPLMGAIFKGAQKVLGWLGVGTDQTQRGMRMLARLSQSQPEIQSYGITNNSDVVDSVGQFFELPWFRRLWIVQETVLNMDLRLTHGEIDISFTRLVAGLRILKSRPCWSHLRLLSGVQAIEKTISVWESHQSTSLQLSKSDSLCILTLLEMFIGHASGDPRDRIFAMHSLASDISSTLPSSLPPPGSSIKMEVDYSLDVLQTYARFAAACFNSTHAAMILCAASTRINRLNNIDWPSWVPDWRISSKAIYGGHIAGLLSPNPELKLRHHTDFPKGINLHGSKILIKVPALYKLTAIHKGNELLTVSGTKRWIESSLKPPGLSNHSTLENLDRLIRELQIASGSQPASCIFDDIMEPLTGYKIKITKAYMEYTSKVRSFLSNRYLFVTSENDHDGSIEIVFGYASCPISTDDRILPISVKHNGHMDLRAGNINAIVLRPTNKDFDLWGNGCTTASYRIIGDAFFPTSGRMASQRYRQELIRKGGKFEESMRSNWSWSPYTDIVLE